MEGFKKRNRGWRRKWQPSPIFLPGIPWTEEPGGLQYMGLQRVGYNRATNTFTFNYPQHRKVVSYYCTELSLLFKH